MNSELHSDSPDSTFRIGQALGKLLRGCEVILLAGDLGVGKTLLTKGIASALHIDADEIVSPTFTLMNRFQAELGERRVPFFHFDLYRWGEGAGQQAVEIDECIGEGIIVVEWAQYLHSSYFELEGVLHLQLAAREDEESHRIIRVCTAPAYIRTGL
jgi:tRNA threonylcarbamoyladenosine biosynthesis protein TsaE